MAANLRERGKNNAGQFGQWFIAEQTFFRNRQNVPKPIDFAATLLEGKVKYQKLPSGSSDYIEFYDKNGDCFQRRDVLYFSRHTNNRSGMEVYPLWRI